MAKPKTCNICKRAISKAKMEAGQYVRSGFTRNYYCAPRDEPSCSAIARRRKELGK